MTLFRLLAIATVLLFTGQSLLPALHHALMPHEVCAEHGDLVHVGERRAQDTAEATTTAPPSGPLDHAVQASGDEGHAHDHCATCAAYRLHGITQRASHPTPSDSRATGRTPVARACDVCFPDGHGLHRLAPKQGPPGTA